MKDCAEVNSEATIKAKIRECLVCTAGGLFVHEQPKKTSTSWESNGEELVGGFRASDCSLTRLIASKDHPIRMISKEKCVLRPKRISGFVVI